MPRPLHTVAVFSGSRPGARPSYARAAARFAEAMAKRGLGLVYGGASVGLMGVVADGLLAAGGRVLGVIPRALAKKEVAHGGLDELVVVGTMHERKAIMADRADGFVALPGGFGTFDELFEIVTWAQLGMHDKPIGLLDVDGYFQPVRDLVRRVIDEGFALPEHEKLVIVESDPEALLDAMARYEPPALGTKWIASDDR